VTSTLRLPARVLAALRPPATPEPREDPHDFSVVLGGPLYQLARGAHLSGDALELLRRRVVVIVLLTWLPLLILAVLGGRAWGDAVRVPFLLDIGVHARFLLAVPLMIVAELVVHQRMRPLVRQFLERGLIAEESRARFDAALPAARRLRNSVVAEVLLIAFVYVVGVFYVWPIYGAMEVATWYATPRADGSRLSVAGWWYVYVSIPAFQFILLRWYFRMVVWMRFLWQVSRCRLHLVPTHPDRVGGLGFLSGIVVAFAPLLASHGVWLAGLIANQIFFRGATLPDFKVQLLVIVVFLLLLVLGPLLLFVPHLSQARRIGLREYGTLAQGYVRAFDHKWLRGGAARDEPLLGTGDIQSLADLGNSFEVVQGMSVIPFSKQTVVQLAVITLLPVVPLLLTMVSFEELLKGLLKLVL
jgi:hypothetical protein